MTPQTHAAAVSIANEIRNRIGLEYQDLPLVVKIVEAGIEGLVQAEAQEATQEIKEIAK